MQRVYFKNGWTPSCHLGKIEEYYPDTEVEVREDGKAPLFITPTMAKLAVERNKAVWANEESETAKIRWIGPDEIEKVFPLLAEPKGKPAGAVNGIRARILGTHNVAHLMVACLLTLVLTSKITDIILDYNEQATIRLATLEGAPPRRDETLRMALIDAQDKDMLRYVSQINQARD